MRISVFDMLRTIAVKRLESTARSTGSKARVAAAPLAQRTAHRAPPRRRSAATASRPCGLIRIEPPGPRDGDRAGVEDDRGAGQLEDRRALDPVDVRRAEHRRLAPALAVEVGAAAARVSTSARLGRGRSRRRRGWGPRIRARQPIDLDRRPRRRSTAKTSSWTRWNSSPHRVRRRRRRLEAASGAAAARAPRPGPGSAPRRSGRRSRSPASRSVAAIAGVAVGGEVGRAPR